jgi:hypothetical protein
VALVTRVAHKATNVWPCSVSCTAQMLCLVRHSSNPVSEPLKVDMLPGIRTLKGWLRVNTKSETLRPNRRYANRVQRGSSTQNSKHWHVRHRIDMPDLNISKPIAALSGVWSVVPGQFRDYQSFNQTLGASFRHYAGYSSTELETAVPKSKSHRVHHSPPYLNY